MGRRANNSKTAKAVMSRSCGRCPWCGSRLLLRYKRNTWKKFVGCSNYPKCHYATGYAGPAEKTVVIESDDYNAEWRIAERAKADRLKKSGDIHCPRCDVGLLKIQSVDDRPFVGCNQPACDYKEDYEQEQETAPTSNEESA